MFLPKYNLLKVDLLILMSSIHQERVRDIPAMLPQVPSVALSTVLNTKFNINLGKHIRVKFQHLCMTRILGPSNPINSIIKRLEQNWNYSSAWQHQKDKKIRKV